jgi:hypothetical protein
MWTPKIFFSLTILASAMLFVSCGKNVTAPQTQGITVKGFYIGMPAAQVLQQIKNTAGVYDPGVNGQGYDPSGDIMPGGHDYISTDAMTSGNISEDMSRMIFLLDHNTKKLEFIGWNRAAVDLLFNSANLNSQEFAQQFANSYNIPEFKHRQTPSGEGQWIYTSPDNIVITITDDKDLQIKRDTSQQDIQKSFN